MSDIKLFTSVSEAVQSLFGLNRFVSGESYAAGGDINEACILTLDDGTTLFMKSNSAASLGNFMAEAAGLDEIRATGAIGVPEVLGAGTDAGRSFLLLSCIGGSGRIRHYWDGRHLRQSWRPCIGRRPAGHTCAGQTYSVQPSTARTSPGLG